MASPVKKKRLHELDMFTGDVGGGVILFSKDGKEYQVEVGSLSETPDVQAVLEAPIGVSLDIDDISTDWLLHLNEPSKQITITERPLVPIGQRIELTITLSQSTGANTVVWPSNVKWPNDAEPRLSYTKDAQDMFLLTSVDSGKSWRGLIIAMGY